MANDLLSCEADFLISMTSDGPHLQGSWSVKISQWSIALFRLPRQEHDVFWRNTKAKMTLRDMNARYSPLHRLSYVINMDTEAA